ncbi:hypothetical protein [Extibacter muris]|uniref:hypothetical protein n=1 Tax=Extibacter muris TaxID=1796622 RepID=UPI001D0859F5|nr:hypothetical protein [Extibacter muris]MCB6201293.1 hypothetical protein [Extibacter muris]MCQ4664552.1 hypothetical protein [Extibacter muris]MCQ4693807.1 hypothetical protein [Extibacter muris]
MVIAVILLLASGIVLLIVDGKAYATETDGTLTRNRYGRGSKTEELEIGIQGDRDRIPIQLEVQEQQYGTKEIKKVFDRAISQMERRILGTNKSLDHIEEDMELIQEIPEEPIAVEWELDRYDVMNIYGELQHEALEEKGSIINMKAVLTYKADPQNQALYQCTAILYPKELKGVAKLVEKVRDAAEQTEEDTRTEKKLNLPDTVDDKVVSYYRKMNMRGAVLAVMAVLVAILLYAQEKQNEFKKDKEKRLQMLLDYPELANKFTLLLGAGLTVRNTWKKMVRDYEEHIEERGIRYAYEEMKITLNEMQSGVTEAESYERFGRRCKVQEYVKFGALLSQNLRKGTKGLVQLLRMDALQAFEERKARARRLGEEAGTKLLLPMFLMLTVVLVIVVVPAFLSMQM